MILNHRDKTKTKQKMSTLIKILLGLAMNVLGADAAPANETQGKAEVINCETTAQQGCKGVMEAHYIISKNELLSLKSRTNK